MRRACGTRLLALSAAVLASVGAVVTGATRAGAATPPAVAAAGATEEYSVLAPLAVRTLLLDVRVVPGGGLVAVGQRGHVLLSSDGGQSWRQRLTPTRATLTAVHFADAQHGWAVGHDEVILRTTDGGETWSRAHFAPDKEQPLLAVCFADAQTGLAVGAYSTVYRSADGGATWVSAPFEPRPVKAAAAAVARDPKRDVMREDEGVAQPHLNAIVAGAGTRLYIAAEAGHLYRSDDGGETWLELPSPYEGSFSGVLPLDGDSLLVFGLRGHLYRSDDAGLTWRQLATGTITLLAGGTRLPDGTIVIAGAAGVVLVSTDGARTFERHQEADRKGFAAVAPAGDGVALVGEAGVRLLPLAVLLGRRPAAGR